MKQDDADRLKRIEGQLFAMSTPLQQLIAANPASTSTTSAIHDLVLKDSTLAPMQLQSATAWVQQWIPRKKGWQPPHF